ncbi:MAG: response regulator [Acidimicrobiales bacterium]
MDEPDTLLTLRRDLEAAGHDTTLAADADTAFKRLATLPIDAVALDVTMPVGDGWTVLRRMRETPASPPVIVVSAQASPGEMERARQLGAVGCVSAPYAAEDLDRAVTDAMTTVTTAAEQP